MAKVFEKLEMKHNDFIRKQKLFFVATAPLSDSGHVNLSPKGYDSFAVIDDATVAWLDLGGSGIETLAHLKENGRITIMFCAFEGAANILRLYGRGEAVQFDDSRFPELLNLFPEFDQARSIVVVKLDRVQDSCGWGVPFMDFKEHREQLKRNWDHARTKPEGAEAYYRMNEASIDGLKGIE
ncbi:MAG: pyridoxamine 5'-phosphate oxidase [Ponticaulis sp.]|nr:pyridoxamine 5'-phosphate oxidase [Ponticaulis sp.]